MTFLGRNFCGADYGADYVLIDLRRLRYNHPLTYLGTAFIFNKEIKP